MSFPQVTAAVLAGGKGKRDLLAATGVENLALLVVHGETMLSRVVRALKQSGCVGKVYVVGHLPVPDDCVSLPDRGDFVENVLQVASAVDKNEFILYATADTPFLTPQAVEDFVARGLLSGAEMCYPVVPLELCERRFPNIPRTALRLREGAFTGGNLLLIRAGVVQRQAELLRRAFAARKSVWAMAGILGGGIIVRALLARLLFPRLLSIAHIKARVQQLMGATAQEIVTEYVEVGVDIDRVEHLQVLKGADYLLGDN